MFLLQKDVDYKIWERNMHTILDGEQIEATEVHYFSSHLGLSQNTWGTSFYQDFGRHQNQKGNNVLKCP